MRGAVLPSDGSRHAEWCAAKLIRNARDIRVSDAGCRAKKLAWFENRRVWLVSYRPLAAAAAPQPYLATHSST